MSEPSGEAAAGPLHVQDTVQPLDLLSPADATVDEAQLSASSASTPEVSIAEVATPKTSGVDTTQANTGHHPLNQSNQRPRLERLSSSGHDVLKKTIKDLQRSSVSLARFEVLLEAVS